MAHLCYSSKKFLGGAIPFHCDNINYLLVTYATDEVTSNSLDDITNWTWRPIEISMSHKLRFWGKLLQCGPGYVEAMQKRILIEGLLESIRS